MMTQQYAPISTGGSARLTVVDALRGFAVMAILLVHCLEHFIYARYPELGDTVWGVMNQKFFEMFWFLFAGKSYTMFALLFGFTYAIQLRNQMVKGRDFAGRFAWRMLWLLMFGSLNALLFPGGDVLVLFAIAGLILIPMRRWKTRALVLATIFFLLQPQQWIYAGMQWLQPGWTPFSLGVSDWYASLMPAIDQGHFFEMLWRNVTAGQWASLSWGIEAGRLMQAPGLFLLGFLLGKGNYFVNTPANAQFWVRTLILSVVGASVFYVVKSSLPASTPMNTIFTMWHNICFSGVWIAMFVLLYRLDYFKKLVRPLESYGRMSLTNYLSQSVLGALVFFPFALGGAAKLSYISSFAVGVVLMLMQIWFSVWWFKSHKIGPMEGLWHKLTWINLKKG